MTTETIQRATYTVREVAKLIGVSEPTVYGLLHNGTLPHRRFGRRWIIPKAALHRWLDETKAKQHADFGGFLA